MEMGKQGLWTTEGEEKLGRWQQPDLVLRRTPRKQVLSAAVTKISSSRISHRLRAVIQWRQTAGKIISLSTSAAKMIPLLLFTV